MHGWSKGGIMMIMTEGESGSAVQRESEADEWFWIHKRRPISVEKFYFLLQLIQLQNFEWIQHQWYKSMREHVWWRDRVKQMIKAELHGWMSAQMGEGWEMELKRYCGYVRGNKWTEEEGGKGNDEAMRDKDRWMDNDAGV